MKKLWCNTSGKICIFTGDTGVSKDGVKFEHQKTDTVFINIGPKEKAALKEKQQSAEARLNEAIETLSGELRTSNKEEAERIKGRIESNKNKLKILKSINVSDIGNITCCKGSDVGIQVKRE